MTISSSLIPAHAPRNRSYGSGGPDNLQARPPPLRRLPLLLRLQAASQQGARATRPPATPSPRMRASLTPASAPRAPQEDDDEEHDVSENRLVVFVRRFLPVAEHYSGDAFFVVQEGRRMATPLLLVLVVVELTDVARAAPK